MPHGILKIILFFQSNKQRYEKKTLSTHVAVDNYHDVDTEDTYVTMGPNMALDGPDNQYDYVTMPGAGVNKTGKLHQMKLQLNPSISNTQGEQKTVRDSGELERGMSLSSR